MKRTDSKVKNHEKRILEFRQEHLKPSVMYQITSNQIDVYGLAVKDVKKKFITRVLHYDYSITITVGGKTKILMYN